MRHNRLEGRHEGGIFGTGALGPGPHKLTYTGVQPGNCGWSEYLRAFAELDVFIACHGMEE